MTKHPATKFQSKTGYFAPDVIKERETCLAEFFVAGPYDYAMLLTLLGVWNDQFIDGTCKHTLWIAKPQASAGAAPDAPVLKQELSKRIASRLARWKWLNYTSDTSLVLWYYLIMPIIKHLSVVIVIGFNVLVEWISHQSHFSRQALQDEVQTKKQDLKPPNPSIFQRSETSEGRGSRLLSSTRIEADVHVIDAACSFDNQALVSAVLLRAD